MRLIIANFDYFVVGCKTFWVILVDFGWFGVISDSFEWFRLVLDSFEWVRVVCCFGSYPGLSNFHKMVITVMKMTFQKENPMRVM